MSTVKVAINGFGRIGRLAYRQIYNMEGIDVVAINDLTSPKVLAHLLKYDSAQGRFDADVKSTEDSIVVNGDILKIYAQKDPSQIPWGAHDVDVVLECTGFFADKTKAEAHISAGAKKVVITDGPNGSYASYEGKLVSMPNYPDPAPPYDRTGAGDAFASTIVAALALGESMETALLWAPINSMSVVQKLGAQAGLLNRHQVEQLLESAPVEYEVKEYTR